jgi:hypothetical protein
MNLVKSIELRVKLYLRFFLYIMFHFDQWHRTPILFKPYVLDISKFLNKQKSRNSYLEIGCGLGDIIRNVNYKKRLGLDAENDVLRAARFVSFITFERHIQFKRFIFPDDSISDRYDVIIMVNWIHNIEPEILNIKIRDYFHNNLIVGGIIVIDTVNHEGYKYYHNIDKIAEGLLCEFSLIGHYEYNRKIWSIKKLSDV